MSLKTRLFGAVSRRIEEAVARGIDDAVRRNFVGAVTPPLYEAVTHAFGRSVDVQWRRYLALALLSSRDPGGRTLSEAECRVFSQNGEDGVIHELVGRIDGVPKTFVEFGAARGQEGNCVLLADVAEWSGLFIEMDREMSAALRSKYSAISRVQTVRETVTPNNVDELLLAAGIDEQFGVWSIDVDGPDYWIWKASGFRPAIVVIEYNGMFEPDSRVACPYVEGARWDGGREFGASLGALYDLGREKGYTLVHTELTGVNAFFVRDDLADGLPSGAEVPWRAANYQFQGFDYSQEQRGYVTFD
jgi:hypothetical protein